MAARAKKNPIEISADEAVQQENLPLPRKTLKIIQEQGIQKENLNSRQGPKPLDYAAEKKKTACKGIQTVEQAPSTVTAEDLVAEVVSDGYWKGVAVTRSIALDRSLRENLILKDMVEDLRLENENYKEMLKDCRNMILVLEDILENNQVPHVEVHIDEEED